MMMLSEALVPLKPGEKLEEDAVLNKLFDISSPGKYLVKVSRPVSDDPKDGGVESNEISISVR